MIHREPLFIYIHVPKTGGSAIEKAFRRKWDPRYAIDDPFNIRSNLVQHESEPHLPARVLKQSFPLTFRRAFKFCFVRNPWDYTVSAYCWLAKYTGLRTPFDEWVRRRFAGIPEREMNIFMTHCQLDWITDAKGSVIVDFVGRFESLQSEFDRVTEKLGMDRIKLPVSNASKGRKPYPEYYDAETKEIIAEHFRRDIDRFGFQFEGRPGAAHVRTAHHSMNAANVAGEDDPTVTPAVTPSWFFNFWRSRKDSKP